MRAFRAAVAIACCVTFAGNAPAQGKGVSSPGDASAERAVSDDDRHRAEQEKRRQERERRRAEIEARMRASRERAIREGRLSPSEVARIERVEAGGSPLPGPDVQELGRLRREVSALREEISALRRVLEGQRGAGLVRPAPPAPKKLGQPMKAK